MEVNVLLAEDDYSTRALLSELLSIHDYKATVAHNGDDAATKLATGLIDILITDLNMDGADGIGLLDHVTTSYPHIPALVTSSQFPTERLGRFPIYHFLRKPFHRDELLSLLYLASRYSLGEERRYHPRMDLNLGVSFVDRSLARTVTANMSLSGMQIRWNDSLAGLVPTYEEYDLERSYSFSAKLHLDNEEHLNIEARLAYPFSRPGTTAGLTFRNLTPLERYALIRTLCAGQRSKQA